MKQLMLLLLLCLGSYSAAVSQVTSQAPQYYYAPQFDDTTLAITNNFSSVAFTQGFGISSMPSQKWVCIYYPRNFKYPPKGKITSMYFWIDVAATSDTNGLYEFYNVKWQMGTTTRDSFAYDSINKRFLLFDDEKELTTVLQANPYILDSTSGIPAQSGFKYKKWLKVPLQVPFMFDPNKNLVLQLNNLYVYDTLHGDCNIAVIGCHDSLSLNKYRGIGTPDSSSKYAYIFNLLYTSLLPCIGFDLDTTGVSEVEEIKATSLQLYPNPTKDYLYLSTPPSPNTAYTITDITGRQLLQGVVKDNTISVQSLQPGLYLLRIGTQVLRFVKEE